MHCLYLIISPISLTQQSDKLNYHLVSHYREGHLDEYIRYRGSIPNVHNLGRKLGNIHHFPLAIIAVDYSWGKLCATDIIHLQEVYNYFGGRPNREVNLKKGSSDLMDKDYMVCHNILLQARDKRSKIRLSSVINAEFAPCTLKILLRLVSSNHAKVVGPFSSYSHQKKSRLSVIGNVNIPAKNILDSPDPIISTVIEGTEMHLVSVAGYLKLIIKKGPDIFEIMPRLGDHPDDKLYDFLVNYEAFHQVAPKLNLEQASIV
ncbi:BgTH12-05138 [Blumeria graminis f. sp. triticale]|uniref:BgtAc-30466 n=3 Tax=Blumeria graminis TaxID=34373 RepID=A0A9X9MH58_BLUGR|nr:hypothetical protein BGT96224_Ac30466 [Blumeria graminis f. sp. tritici 96224]CAD6502547.1 BgTH12-05138 [Blumeria graminis f. sp. triticale]VDB87944.1 BgtAc-30466 [Blumeria graminis f. sp. tritici]